MSAEKRRSRKVSREYTRTNANILTLVRLAFFRVDSWLTFLRASMVGVRVSREDMSGLNADCWMLSMPKFNRDGVDLYYEIHGSGPTILLSHGFSATAEMWRGQVEPLSRHYQLILWDMRGHGQTDSPDDPGKYSEEATVADMAALLDAAEAECAIVGGLSLGGYMSLAFYLAHPERVRALLLFDTGPGFKNDEARVAWNQRALETASSFEREGLAYLQSRGREMAMSTHRSARGLALAARGMLAQRDAQVMKSLPNIKVPALIVVGAGDTAFLAPANYMASKIPNSRKIVIPDAGHASNLDQPEMFNRAVTGFLKIPGTID